MKKFLILIAVLVFTSTLNIQSVFANGGSTLSSSEKKVVTSILVKEVNRDLIQELELNEMQFIKLKDLYRKYQKEVQLLKDLETSNAAQIDVKTQELSNRYFLSIANLLTEKQILNYLNSNPLSVR